MPERLKEKKILVTRPRDQADNLCRLIEKENGTAIHLPVMEIKPVENELAIQELLSRISSYDIGIFISQNAVRCTLELLNKDIHALYDLKVVAIGKATARLLKQEGIKNIDYADTVATSEALLELPVFDSQHLKNARVVIFRGVGGREYLAERLSERGAYVDYLEVYHRLPCKHDNTVLNNIFFNEKPDMIVVTSNEGLQNLFDMLSSDQREVVLNTQLLVLSKRMETLALKLGFSKMPVIADEASDRGMLKAIIHTAGVSAL